MEVDGKLLRRLKLIEQAVDDHHVHLKRYIWRMCRNEQDAEDIIQKLWRYVLTQADEKVIGELRFLRWKAKRLYFDLYARQRPEYLRRVEQLPENAATSPVAEEALGPEEEAALRQRFWEQFPGIELSASQQEAIWLFARYRYTYEEIAERLDIPRSTVGDWIVVARKRLKEQLEKEGGWR